METHMSVLAWDTQPPRQVMPHEYVCVSCTLSNVAGIQLCVSEEEAQRWNVQLEHCDKRQSIVGASLQEQRVRVLSDKVEVSFRVPDSDVLYDLRFFSISIQSEPHCRIQSPSIEYVRGRLTVVKDPNSVFYKDENSKTRYLNMMIRLDGPIPFPEKHQHRCMPLCVDLLYADDDSLVSDQEILTWKAEPRLVVGLQTETTIDMYIAEVTQKHGSRRFRLRVHVDETHATYSERIASCLSSAIEVRSKRSKRKRASSSYLQTVTSTKEACTDSFRDYIKGIDDITDAASLSQWTEQVVRVFRAIEWKRVPTQALTSSDGKQFEVYIYQCPYCRVLKEGSGEVQHANTCLVHQTLLFMDRITEEQLHGMIESFTAHQAAQDAASVEMPQVPSVVRAFSNSLIAQIPFARHSSADFMQLFADEFNSIYDSSTFNFDID